MSMTAAEYRRVILERMGKHPILPRHTETSHFYEHVPTGKTVASVTARTGLISTDTKSLQRWASRLAAEYVWDKCAKGATPHERDQILKAAVEVHSDAFSDAGDIGTRIHAACEAYTKDWMDSGVKPPDARIYATDRDVRVMAGVRSLERFMNDSGAEPVISELLVASPRYGFAGTLDSLMLMGGKLCLVDLKSSNNIRGKESYALQVVAYLYALEELTEIRPERLLILRLDKQRADYDLEEVQDLPKAFDAFLAVSKVFDWLSEENQKSVDVFKRKVKLVDNI